MIGLLNTPKVARAPRLGPNHGRLAALAADCAALTQVLPLAAAPALMRKSTLPALPAPGAVKVNPGKPVPGVTLF